jgi:hypothetical protein
MLRLVLTLLLLLAAIQVPLLLLARLLAKRLRWEALLLGSLLPLALLAPWLPGDRVLAPTDQLREVLPGTDPRPLADPYRELNDIPYCLLPWELEVRHALAEHRLPLWSDLLDGGSSPWSNPQAQALSPVAMLARAVPIQSSLLASLALKLMVALQGAWVLCRLVGAGRPAAALGGASFALGGGILGWSLFPHSTVAAWAPWVVAATLQTVRRPGRGPLVALALATAALALSGQPEVAAGAVALAALVSVVLGRRRERLLRGVLAAALGGALGFALAAPQLVPFLLAARHSLRGAERMATVAPHVTPGAGAAAWFVEGGSKIFRAPASPLALGAPYGPQFLGPWAWPLALSAYTGLVALAGGLAVLGTRGRRRAAPFLLAWVATLILASRFVPLERAIFMVPLLRVPELSRYLPVGCLGLAVAAALGLDALLRARHRTSSAPGLLAATVATLALLPALILTPAASILGLALLVAAGLWLLAARRRRLGLACLGAALLLDLLPWARAQLPAARTGDFYPQTPTIATVARETADGRWRAAAEHLLVYPSLLTVYGVAEVRPHNPLASREQLAVLARGFGFAPGSAYHSYFASFGRVEHPLLDFLNVRIVISNVWEPPKHRLVKVAGPDRRGFVVYRNPRALPRWFLPVDAEPVSRRKVLPWIERLSDARRVALVAEEARGWRPAPRAWDPAAVRALSSRPGHLLLHVAGGGERLLATSLPGPAGWRAWGGGRALALLTVNAAFLGIRVPAGVDRVELRYTPPGLEAGAALALASLAALAAVALPGWLSLRPSWAAASRRGSGRSRAGSRA